MKEKIRLKNMYYLQRIICKEKDDRASRTYIDSKRIPYGQFGGRESFFVAGDFCCRESWNGCGYMQGRRNRCKNPAPVAEM